MWMSLLLVLTITLSQGLEFELDLDGRVHAGSTHVCAVLRCLEQRKSATSPSGRDTKIRAAGNKISSLTISKLTGVSASGRGRETEGIVLASVTIQQPRITRMSDGIKVEGSLDSGQASLTLEMVNSTDCLANFECRLRTVDVSGEESVSVSRVQQGKTRRLTTGDPGLLSSISLQLLDLVHQLDVKLTMTRKSTEELESKMDSLDRKLDTLETKLGSGQCKTKEEIETKLEDLKERVQSNRADFQSNLAALQNRLEDKLEGSIEDKVSQLLLQVTGLTKTVGSFSEDVSKSLNKSLTVLSQNLQHEQKDALKYLVNNQNDATNALLAKATNVTQSQSLLQNDILNNLAQAVQGISESGEDVSKSLTEELDLLGKELHNRFLEMASNVNQTAVETLSSARGMFLQSNATLTQIDAIKDILSPKICRRGMANVLSSATYPYPLIQSGKDSIIDVPYLCDTITDKGGWVIIQRRTIGNVDFQRRWKDVKVGFGDLSGDFWLGLEHVHKMTSSGHYELRVEMKNQGKSAYAQYGRFSIAEEANGYRLSVANYTGTAGNSLSHHNGHKFTTIDRDNDARRGGNCANVYAGAWWYKSCGPANLNGKWATKGGRGMLWLGFSSSTNPLSYSEMKIRRLTV